MPGQRLKKLTDERISLLKRKNPTSRDFEIRNEGRLVFEKVETAIVSAHVEEQADRRTAKHRASAETRVVRNGAAAAAFDERLLDQETVIDERKHAVGSRPTVA